MDYQDTLRDMKKNMDKLLKINAEKLTLIQDKEPEKVAQILKDQKKIIKAISEGDSETLNQLKKSYADNRDK